MLTERCLQSATLGKMAQEFISWSTATGNDLRRMRSMSRTDAHNFAAESPQFHAFPLERIKVLHHRDRIHYPAVLLARSRTGTETNIQSFNLITGAKQRYAFIVQSEKTGDAVSASIVRRLPLEPSGISIRFGRRRDYPNYVSCYGASCVDVDLSGQVYAIAPESWGKDAIVDWIGSALHHLRHGISMQRMPNVHELSDIGFLNADPNHSGGMSSFFSQHPTYLG